MFLRVFLRRLTSCLRRAQRGSFRKSFPSRKSTQVARAILYKVRAAFASGEASAHSSGERHLPNPSLELDAGLTSSDAAKRIEFGPYGEWRAPARLYMNVERAYREFRNEPPTRPGIRQPPSRPFTRWRKRKGSRLSASFGQGLTIMDWSPRSRTSNPMFKKPGGGSAER